MKIKVRVSLATVLLLTLVLGLNGVYAQDSEEITSYSINVKYNEEDKILDATEEVKFTNNYEDSLENLILHLYPDSYGSYETMPEMLGGAPDGEITEEKKGDIDIKKVLIEGQEVKFTEDNQILDIKLSKPLKPKESIEFTIDFSVKIPKGMDRLGYYKDGVSITNWHPIMSIYNSETDLWDTNPFHPIGESNYSDIANYNVTLEVPKDMEVAATGVTQSEETKGDTKVIDIKAENVRDFVFMMNKNYKVISKEVDGIKINCFYTPHETAENKEKDAQIMLDTVSDSVEFFNETIGKYPYKELDIAETYLAGGAMEYPQLLQMGGYGNFSENYKESEMFPFVLSAAVHEAVHQWWYVSVGSNEFEESVMDESLTVFTTAYYFEKEYGKYHGNGVLMDVINNLKYMQPQRTPFSAGVDEFVDYHDYVDTIYRRGPALFEGLRKKVGEEKFLEILSTYYDKYLFKNGSIEGFLGVIEEVAGKEVMNEFKNDINSDNYTLDDYNLSEEEQKKIRSTEQKMRLARTESIYGTTFSSIKLRALREEKIIIVKPSIMEELEATAVNDVIKSIKKNLPEDNDKIIEVKSANEITEEEINNNNIIYFGNIEKNRFLKDEKSLVKVKENQLLLENIVINDENPTGTYIIKHPKNKNKLLINVFWNKINWDYQIGALFTSNNFLWNQVYDYRIITEDHNEILGRH